MAKILDRLRKVSRSYRVDRDSKEFGSMDRTIYREVSRRNPKISIEKEVLSRYRGGIELSVKSLEEEISRRRNNTL